MDPMVLRLAHQYRGEVYGVPGAGDNQVMRRDAAYTQFVLMVHGRLGARVQIVVPSCSVWKIRAAFLDQSGTYTGFIASRLG